METSRVVSGALGVYDILDEILVDPTIRVPTLVEMGRRIQLALRARGVDEAGRPL